MTDADKDLLELAAKAVGLRVTFDGDNPPYPRATGDGHWNPFWNPLTDDGDALRLAVKLGVTVTHDPEERPTEVGAWTGARYIWIKYAADPYAATRRAIVRAAATIAKESP